MTRYLSFVAWAACVVYSTIPSFWFLIHPRADYWRARRTSPYRVLLPYWFGLWALFGAITWPWRTVHLYTAVWMWIPAACLLATGVFVYVRATQDFSPAQLGGVPEVRPRHREQRLATSGIRARVRHPVYLGHLCELLAWSVGSGLAVCYGLTGLAIVTGAIMIRMEDAELEHRFGDEYRAYQKSVPAVLPFKKSF